jgi:preprotein translocase subunit YajC
MGETSLSLRRGQEVGVTIGGMLQQVARVRWVNGKRFGLKFAHPVNLRMLRAAMMAPKSPATVIVAASKDQRRPGLRIR